MRKEGYIDNRGNYVRPGPDYQRLLMVALMNALAMLLAERMVSGLQFGNRRGQPLHMIPQLRLEPELLENPIYR